MAEKTKQKKTRRSKKGKPPPKQEIPFETIRPLSEVQDWQDFTQWMKDRAQALKDSDSKPLTLGHTRPNAIECRKNKELLPAWQNEVRRRQYASGRRTMIGQETIKDRAAKDELFQECCSTTGKNPSRRQYSKWLRGRGGARTELRGHLEAEVGGASAKLEMAKKMAKNSLHVTKKALTQCTSAKIEGLLRSNAQVFSDTELAGYAEFEIEDYDEEEKLQWLTDLAESKHAELTEEVEKIEKSIEAATKALQDAEEKHARLIKQAR